MIQRLSLLAALLCATVLASGGGGTRGRWKVLDAHGDPCMAMYSEVKLTLMYYRNVSEEARAVSVKVPASSTTTGSSCNTSVYVQGDMIQSQVMQLNFDHYPGWILRLAFTQDSRFNPKHNQFVLYQVNVTANYSSMADKFPDWSTDVHTYYQPVSLSSAPVISDSVYADVEHSYFCSAAQLFNINDDAEYGPGAQITFSALQVQAFIMDNVDGVFDERETCSYDQKDTDKVPIITAGVLAGLIALTLVAYLVYRARLPASVINQVNPESHYENEALHLGEDDGKGSHVIEMPH